MIAWSRRLSALVALVAFVAAGVPARAQGPAPGGAASGTVRASDGTPIAKAVVALRGNGPLRSARSDAAGRFQIDGLRAGTYLVDVHADGYTPLTGQTVQITDGRNAVLDVALPRAQVASLVTIGAVTANGTRALSTSPAPTLEISAQPYAQQGVTRVSDILTDQLSTTVYPILGGGLNAPAVVALRGPDPSETLVDVDGHQVNNGSTGDFDLSLLDPADLQSIQVVYGIAPSALYGPNTLGGALNVRTLEPTTTPQTTVRFSDGSYDTFADTFDTTGTVGRLGYAFSYHRVTSGGQLDDYLIPTTSGNGVAPISNALDAGTVLGKLRYALPAGGFVGLTFSDQSVFRDLSATLSAVQLGPTGTLNGATYTNESGTTLNDSTIAYGLDAEVPLGPKNAEGSALTTAIFRQQNGTAFQSVGGPGTGSSPYLYDDHDRIVDDTLEIVHELPHGSLTLKYALTDEGLLTDYIPGVIFADAYLRQPIGTTVLPFDVARADATSIPGIPDSTTQFLSQTERSLGLLYQIEPTAKLHYAFAAYDSDYSTFGHSLDPRVGFTWTPTADVGYRASVGTTFQSPQLPGLLIPPVLPAPAPSDTVPGFYSSIGNPHLTAEHATSYDLGADHVFGGAQPVTASLDVYRTDLHNGVATYYSPTPCTSVLDDPATCLSYPVNVTREVYEGIELRAARPLAPHTTLRFSYDVDSVFTKDVPAGSADNFPNFQQSAGVPLHKATLDLAHDGRSIAYYAGVLYEGEYNELNLPPYATLRAGVTWHAGKTLDLGLYGTNLTNVYNFKLTELGQGILYGTIVGGPQAADALPLAGPQITFTAALHT
ncbi:MAG TPA: TonB-dependent receptor [Candidatus Sulfotelmatobacter sp.]|nr:TonB-dependent receptor [Candidatus Sulfotelmatobacter sp.]